MLEAVNSIVQQICFLDLTKPVVAGCSGGPDSLCLLDALHRLGLPVIAAHLNHGLRPEAAQEARFVGGEAQRRGVPFVSQEADVARYAGENSLSLEEAARSLRYRFLFEQALRLGAQAVAVAHTADDQVETVLMHFLRGAGLAGLKGMLPRLLPNPWSESIPLVRPLLFTWREEVLAYCRERGLEPVQDQSNLDTRFTRNRLRHALIPLLEGYNPEVRQAIFRASISLAGDEAVLEGLVEAAWQECLLLHGQGYVAMQAQTLAGQLPGVQRRLVRRAIAWLRPGLRDIDFRTVERALEFLARPTRSARLELAAGLSLFREAEGLWLTAWEVDLPGAHWPQIPTGEAPLALGAPGEVSLPSGWWLAAEAPGEVGPVYNRTLENADPYTTWLDAEALAFPLFVRGRHPGDRFQPLGLAGHSVKLSDYYINVKLPRRAREGWPLVLSAGGEIAWIPGFRPAHPFRLTGETRKAVHLHLRRGKDG
jgi:tRNA(Ile)-lysidine synthase